MVQTQITLSDALDRVLTALAARRGAKKEQIILEAVQSFVGQSDDQTDVLAKRRKAFGMWRDRTDLPDFELIRKSMDRGY